jgi:hypothetical protein
MFDEAVTQFDIASEKNPRLAQPKNNKGIALMRSCRIEDALKAYREAIQIDPSYPDAHLGVSFAALKLGQYEEGWKEFEWRWHNGVMPPRNLEIPEWHGEPAKSQDDGLLLYGEQGYGDVLQFMRYASIANMLAWRGKVFLEVKQPLTRIVQSMSKIDGVITFGEKIPSNVTACAPLGSLPRLLWKLLRKFPQNALIFTLTPTGPVFGGNDLMLCPKAPRLGCAGRA